MAFQDTNNLVDTIVDSQKKVLDSVVENTKKFTNGNNPLNESIEKGTDWYKNWLESQKNIFTKATSSDSSASANNSKTENTANKANEFFEQWMTTQANLAKQMWETAQESAKKFSNGTNTNNPFMPNNPFATTNPFTSFQNPFANMQNPFANMQNPFANMQNPFSNMQNPWSNMMGGMQNNNWMEQMQNMNPFNAEAFKKSTSNVTDIFNQYYTMLNNNFSEWQKSLQNGTAQEAYKNMISSGEGFTKFAEMWMPMFKSIQDKSFNMDTYKQFMNPELYKEFMDKFFGFMPEGSRQQMDQMTKMMNDSMKQMSQSGMGNYTQMRDMMSKMGNGGEIFGNMQNAYNQFNTMMTEAAAPFTKMMTPNQHTKAAAEWNDLANRITTYNLKNAEMQYMIYNQGTKVMDKLAENIAKKVQDGTEITSMLGLYQEWMNISDKVYVSLFESTEYSQLMGEVTGMQNRLRKDIDLQVEKMFKDIPVATRSEMDEVYKTIYDLKKQVRQLEKMLDLDGGEKTEATAPKAEKASKSTKK
jgi:polyhydroxyalkanoate synthase subunit PhaE